MGHRIGPAGARGLRTICPTPDNRWRYPLRRVVEAGPIETLECGHQQVRKSDIIGPTFCDRRRCGECWRALPEAERAAKLAAYEAHKERAERRRVEELRSWQPPPVPTNLTSSPRGASSDAKEPS